MSYANAQGLNGVGRVSSCVKADLIFKNWQKWLRWGQVASSHNASEHHAISSVHTPMKYVEVF